MRVCWTVILIKINSITVHIQMRSKFGQFIGHHLVFVVCIEMNEQNKLMKSNTHTENRTSNAINHYNQANIRMLIFVSFGWLQFSCQIFLSLFH